MTDELNKDVVGARINLDTSKILPAFKIIDDGVKQNAESFKALNAELALTEKSYTSMAAAMDKIALSDDERRQKILAESDALVKQRTAQTELLAAKKNQLDATNQIVDAKLQAQQAIVKKHEDAIEQQEQQHQQKMVALAQKTLTAGAQENLVQAQIDRQFQLMKVSDVKLEMESERHSSQIAASQQRSEKSYTTWWEQELKKREVIDKAHYMALQEDQRLNDEKIKAQQLLAQKQQEAMTQRGSVRSAVSNTGGGFSIGNMALSIGLFTSLNSLYQTMVQGMKDVEDGAAGLHQVFGSQVDDQGKLNQVTNDFVDIAKKYGTSVNDVMQGAKQWGRQYKDIETAMTLTNSSTLLSIVDNVNLADSNRAVEATMNSMGMAAHTQAEAFANSMRIVDSWSALAHKASVSATDLVHATENSAGAAKQAGVDFDQLQAIATSAVRNTGLTGSNIGVMLKSLFASIRSDKSEAALKSLDIGIKRVGANGEKEFRPVFDVLLELSQKLQTTDKNQQKVIETISGGKFQWSKVASMLSDYNTIIDAYAISLNSAGAAQKYAQEQMNTLSRDVQRLKDTFIELAASADQNGLGGFLKTIVTGLTDLIVGLEQLPTGFEVTLLSIGGLLIALKSLNSVMTTLEPLSKVLIVGFNNLNTASNATTAATTAQTAATEGQVVATESQIVATEAQVANTEAQVVVQEAQVVATEAQVVATEAQTVAFEAEMVAQEAQMVVSEGQLVNTEALTVATEAQAVVTGVQTAAVVEETAAFTALDIVSGGLALVIGAVTAGILLSTMATGKSTEATKDHAQAVQQQVGIAQQDLNLAKQKQQFMDTAIKQETNLKKAMDDTTLSADKRNKLMNDLVDLYHAVGKATDDTTLQQVNASNVQNVSLQGQRGEVAKLVDAKKTAYENMVKINDQEVQNDINATNQKIDDINKVIEGLQNETKAKFNELGFWDKVKVGFINYAGAIDSLVGDKKEVATDNQNRDAIEKAARDKLLQDKQNELDKLKVQKAQDEYKVASGKLDLAKIDTSGDASPSGVPDPFGNGNKAFQFPLKDIDNQTAKAKELVDSVTAQIDMYNAKQAAMAQTIDDTAARVEMYTNKQKALHESNVLLEDSVTKLNDKQAMLDQLYNSGKITLDEYNQHSDDVTSHIASLTNEINQNSKAWWDEAKAIKDVKDQSLKDSVDASEKWMAHQKAMGDLTVQQEYEAWMRVKDRLDKETAITQTLMDLRKKADEQVYAAKKAYLADESKQLDDLMSKEKSYLEQSKQAELDKIETAKQKYVDAQDAKIKALDQLMQAEDQANSDQNYADQLKVKQDRLTVLQSAVGPDGIKERKQVIQDIADMEQKHQQDLTKRAQEAEKQSLQDDKTAQVKAYDDQKTEVENNYKDLLTAFDNFKNDSNGVETAIKNFRIQTQKEANQQVLKDLDTFIADYKKKQLSISGLSLSQEQIDLNTYNSNIDKWKTGDAAAKTQAHADNEALRQKYNIPADTGKLQHFADGGVVQGLKSQPVPVIAHAGEMYLNEGQQSNLFKLLNFSFPKLNFSMPNFQMPTANTVVNKYNFNNSITSGDTHLHDSAAAKVFWSERDSLIGRMQSEQGKRIR
ncbi:MAG: yomL [Bacilli bacterium]|nr:yomL [Bacilli bacterium]